MLVKIKAAKLKSATIVETIVAMLILMISFGCGMVIYNKILGAGINDQAMRAETETSFVADSLARTGDTSDRQLLRWGRTYQVKYTIERQYPGLKRMQVICREGNQQLAEVYRLIESDEAE